MTFLEGAHSLKSMKKALALASLVCFMNSHLVMAQGPTPVVEADRLTQESRRITQSGKLFSVKMVPGDSVTSFFVVGKKAVDIKVDNLQVEATYFEGLDEKKARKLVLKRQADHFLYEGVINPGKVRLDIKSMNPTQSEKIEMKMTNP